MIKLSEGITRPHRRKDRTRKASNRHTRSMHPALPHGETVPHFRSVNTKFAISWVVSIEGFELNCAPRPEHGLWRRTRKLLDYEFIFVSHYATRAKHAPINNKASGIGPSSEEICDLAVADVYCEEFIDVGHQYPIRLFG